MRTIYPLQRTKAWRTYLGGAMLNAFFGETDSKDGHYPEEWILSTVTARNAGRAKTNPPEGLNILQDSDISFRDLLASEPKRLLGDAHIKKYGASPGVLVKLIDSAERLAVQVHPDRETAAKLFGSAFGKTECWHILGGREINGEKPCIYFGFKPGITRSYWKKLFDEQNIPEMLNCLHRFEVKLGDTFLIEGGIPHAIGAGCFLVEIQEPTDYTIRTEKVTQSGLTVPDEGCHQGIGFERMFDCFHYDGLPREDVEARWKITKKGNTFVGQEQSGCFELHEARVDGLLEISVNSFFQGIFILEGNGVVADMAEHYNVKKGDQLFIAATAEKIKIESKTPMHMLYFGGPR